MGVVVVLLGLICAGLFVYYQKKVNSLIVHYDSKLEKEKEQFRNRVAKEVKEELKQRLEEQKNLLDIDIARKNEELGRLEEKTNALKTVLLQGKERVDLEISDYKQQKFAEARDAEEKRQNEYVELIKEKVVKEENDWKEFHDTLFESYAAVQSELDDFKKKRDIINEEILRARAIDEQKDFYRICLSEVDIEDIRTLAAIAPQMKKRELVPKLIWDAIVSRPTNEMIKRVVEDKVGGIYKVTYTPTGEVYIGRTTNFKDRFKNHVGTALGLDKAASSTFHTHMAKNGLWNYTWEVLEELPKELHGEREKYWIDFYESNKYGLNMKGGG